MWNKIKPIFIRFGVGLFVLGCGIGIFLEGFPKPIPVNAFSKFLPEPTYNIFPIIMGGAMIILGFLWTVHPSVFEDK